jgi:hypothetical protein
MGRTEDDISKNYTIALSIGERHGMRPLIAHCELALSELAARAGQEDETRLRRDRALTLYREMDMPCPPGRGDEFRRVH